LASPSRPRGLHQGEAAQPIGIIRGERDRGRSASRVSDEVEGLETGLVGGPADPLDLGLEAVARRWDRRAGVHLEILGPRIDVGFELGEQCRIRELGRQDRAWEEDHRPRFVARHQIIARSRSTADHCEPRRVVTGLSSPNEVRPRRRFVSSPGRGSAGPPVSGLPARDVGLAQDVRLRLHLLEAVLDHVADADDPAQDAVG